MPDRADYESCLGWPTRWVIARLSRHFSVATFLAREQLVNGPGSWISLLLLAVLAEHFTGLILSQLAWIKETGVSIEKRTIAEFIGTFWLVLGGCGSAVIAAAYPGLGIGFVGVALAFGLTLLTMAYAIGHISGCHLNPAVSVGLFAGGRFRAGDLLPYIVAQLAGGCAGAGVLYVIARGKAGFNASA